MTDLPPWASVADIGRLGLDTAAAVIERLLALTELTLDRLPGTPAITLLPATGDGVDTRRVRAEAERLVEAYAEWTRSLVHAAVDATDRGRTPPGKLSVGPITPSVPAEATIWLHLLDGPAAGATTLRATDLVAHHGGAIPAAAIRFAPEDLDASSPRTSQAVTVGVTVPPGTAPGPYHGHILAAGLPEVCLEVCVDVVEP